MPDLEKLKNDGIFALNVPKMPVPEKTVVVLGASRSGTTMVASVLQELGVSMGNDLGPVLEDVELSQAVESRDEPGIKRLVEQYNSIHSVWGWKRPSALEYFDVWQGCFRNLYIIAIFRDPFAIANRNRISMLTNVLDNMEQSVKYLGMQVAIVQRLKVPILLCSYEKVLAFPESFVSAVDQFLDLHASARRADAVLRITPAPAKYLDSSRITRALGHLSVVDETLCSGWAFYPERPGRIVNVQIFVNDRLINSTKASISRPDVKAKGLHPTGKCGFQFEWPGRSVPRVGDWVDARVEGDTQSLTGSPQQFEPV